jgi:hypothetical protein
LCRVLAMMSWSGTLVAMTASYGPTARFESAHPDLPDTSVALIWPGSDLLFILVCSLCRDVV